MKGKKGVRALECVLAHRLREFLSQFQTKRVVMQLGCEVFIDIPQSVSVTDLGPSLSLWCQAQTGVWCQLVGWPQALTLESTH